MDKKYVLNTTSGRYILKGGTLHRRLIRQGKMPSQEFGDRKATKKETKEVQPKEVQPKEIHWFDAIAKKLDENIDDDDELAEKYISLTKRMIAKRKKKVVK